MDRTSYPGEIRGVQWIGAVDDIKKNAEDVSIPGALYSRPL
jgi:hypothetical protein